MLIEDFVRALFAKSKSDFCNITSFSAIIYEFIAFPGVYSIVGNFFNEKRSRLP